MLAHANVLVNRMCHGVSIKLHVRRVLQGHARTCLSARPRSVLSVMYHSGSERVLLSLLMHHANASLLLNAAVEGEGSVQGDCGSVPPAGVPPNCLRPRQCVLTRDITDGLTGLSIGAVNNLLLHNLYIRVVGPGSNDTALNADAISLRWASSGQAPNLYTTGVVTVGWGWGVYVSNAAVYMAGALSLTPDTLPKHVLVRPIASDRCLQ